jgi:hypothetical protein
MAREAGADGLAFGVFFVIGFLAGSIASWLVASQVGLAHRQTYETCLEHHEVSECRELRP